MLCKMGLLNEHRRDVEVKVSHFTRDRSRSHNLCPRYLFTQIRPVMSDQIVHASVCLLQCNHLLENLLWLFIMEMEEWGNNYKMESHFWQVR